MKSSQKRKRLTRLLLVLAAFTAAYGSYSLYEDQFQSIESRIVDELFLWRIKAGASPPQAVDQIVHVDANLYFSRSQHARVIENLARMKVAVQLVDFLFADIVRPDDDRNLIDVTRKAGNVIYGLHFESLVDSTVRPPTSDFTAARPDSTGGWTVAVGGDPGSFYTGISPLMPYPELAAAARGIGFLNINADPDGIVRRLPLLVWHGDRFYPSLAFRAVCDYLGVPLRDIVVKPGKSLTLKNARPPAGPAAGDIVIPIDDKGTMLLGATEYWDDIRHYSSSEIYQASANTDRLRKLSGELSGKIVVLSPVLETGHRTRLPDRQAPLYPGAFHALLVQNILSGSYLNEVPEYANLMVQIGMLTVVFLLSMRLSSPALSMTVILMGGLYFSLAAGLFIYSGIIVQIARALLLLGCALVILFIGLGVERAFIFAQTERARRMAEQELEIGRQIQTGFFPTSLPELPGWELAFQFQAARHVAGDFYDVFTLGEDKKVGLVVADICDKGVGAALFMALFRSSIRVLSGTACSEEHLQINNPATEPKKILLKAIQSVNNYISITHEKAGMFATVFYAILDPSTGALAYINGGHEPPVIIGAEGIRCHLKPTGPAVGLYPDLEFKVQTVKLEPHESLVVYTDGVTDARNKSGRAFTRERLLDILNSSSTSAGDLIQKVRTRIDEHIQGENQYDDITILALRRKA